MDPGKSIIASCILRVEVLQEQIKILILSELSYKVTAEVPCS